MILLNWMDKIWNKIIDILNNKKNRSKRKRIKKRKLKSQKRQNKIMGTSKLISPGFNNINVIDNTKETSVLDVDLISDNLSNKDKKKLRQYTKIIISIILSAGIVWITWSYILATIALLKFASFQPLESLSAKICAVVISAIISYSLKSFSETYCLKKNEIELIKMENEYDNFIPGVATQLNNEKYDETNDNAVG